MISEASGVCVAAGLLCGHLFGLDPPTAGISLLLQRAGVRHVCACDCAQPPCGVRQCCAQLGARPRQPADSGHVIIIWWFDAALRLGVTRVHRVHGVVERRHRLAALSLLCIRLLRSRLQRCLSLGDVHVAG